MNGCSCTLEKEYESLRAKVAVRSARYGFARTDMEDILQDVCVRILEDHILDPDDYQDVVSAVISKHRTQRFRRI